MKLLRNLNFWIGIVTASLIAMLLLRKVILFVTFFTQYTDSDQAVLMTAMMDISQGHFYEPCFYGQSYNTIFESLLACPLYMAGVPAPVSLAVITQLLTLIPWFLVLYFSAKTYGLKGLYLSVLVYALFPLKYEMIQGLPRGFIPGIALAALGCISTFYKIKSPVQLGFAGLCGVVGTAFNPNAGPLLVYVLFSIWTQHKWNKRFWIGFLSGCLIGAIYPIYVTLFYKLHANYPVHSMGPTFFSINCLLNFLSDPELFLGDLDAVKNLSGWGLFILCGLLLIISVLVKQKTLLWWSSGLLIMLIGAVSFSKTLNGYDTIFLSSSRMFLAWPLLLSAGLSFISPRLKNQVFTGILLFSFPVASFLLTSGIKQTNTVVATEMAKHTIVQTNTLEEIHKECSFYYDIYTREKASLFLILEYKELLNYACAPLINSDFQTLYPHYERRHWLLEKANKELPYRIIIMDKDTSYLSKFRKMGIPVTPIKTDWPFIYRAELDGKMSVIELCNHLGRPVRKF